MSAPGPIDALLARWRRQALALAVEARALDEYRRGEAKGRAKGLYDAARELEDVVTTEREG